MIKLYQTNRGLYFSLTHINKACNESPKKISKWINKRHTIESLSQLQKVLNEKPHGKKSIYTRIENDRHKLFHQIDSPMTRSMKSIPAIDVSGREIVDYSKRGFIASKYSKSQGSKSKDVNSGRKVTYPVNGVGGNLADVSIHDRYSLLRHIDNAFLYKERMSVNILNEEYGINTILSMNGVGTIANEYMSILYCQYLGFKPHYAILKYIEEYKNNLSLCKESYNHMMQSRFYMNTSTNNQIEAKLMHEIMGTTRHNMSREQLYILHCLQVMNTCWLTDSIPFKTRRMMLMTYMGKLQATKNMNYNKQPYINERLIR